MNKLNLKYLLVTFFFPLLLNAQGWEKIYDTGLNENVAAADLTLDGGVIIAGTDIDNINSIGHSFMYKTDSDGNLQWIFIDSIHTGSFVNTLEVFSTSDGNYLLSSIYGNNPPDNDYVLQKIAPGGNIIWEYEMTTPFLDYVTNISETSDGDYLLTGYYSSNLSSVGVVKLDQAGNVIWETGFTNPNIPYHPGSVISASNGDILVVGYLGYFSAQDVFVKRLDSSGNLIWEKEFDHFSNDFGLILVELPNDEFAIGGSNFENFDNNIATLLKIDGDGNELWFQVYSSLGHQQLGGLQVTSDGGFAFSGYKPNSSGTYNDLYLVKTDSDGNQLWENTYGRSKSEYLGELLLTSNQEFFIVGSTEKPNVFASDVLLVKTDSLGYSFTNQFSGVLFNDENLNCLKESNENGMSQWLIKVIKGDQQFSTLTYESGDYYFTLDTGTYDVVVSPISPYWTICDTTFNITFTNFFDTTLQDIPAQVEIECPLLDVSIGTPFIRRCFPNTYNINYCNYGTTTAEDAYIEITFDEYMIVNSSSIPITNQVGNIFTFDLGDIEYDTCGSFTVDISLGDSTNCDSIILGATHCVEAHIYPDSICLPSGNWSGASVEVDAICTGDSISFFIQNVGIAPTQPNLQYIVVEDDVILFDGNFSLNPMESEVVTIPTNGSTFRLEAEQEPNHPGMSMPNVSVENCGLPSTTFSFGFVNIFAQDDGDPFVDIDCQNNIGAYDPNDKQGFPLGYADENYINRGQDIEYIIRFQNTGTDTAFNVVVKDQLSEFLDISTIRPGASSHAYNFQISGDGLMNFTFNNIMLPDSFVNEPASNGFVKFKVSQKPNLDLETQIFNQAAIYFDFNAPIFTNETLHTIGEDFFVVSIEYPSEKSLVQVTAHPNPFTQFVNFEIEEMEINNGTFQLFDAMGRILVRQNFNNNTFTFQKSDLQAGIYFFTIEENGQLISNGKLIAQ